MLITLFAICTIGALFLVVIPAILAIGAAIQSVMMKLSGVVSGILVVTGIIVLTTILILAALGSLIIFII